MTLRVWLPRLTDLRADSVLAYEGMDARRRILDRGEGVLAALPRGRDCELVLHAFDVSLLDIGPPRLSAARLAAALPGIVEERVVGDIEHAHVVASARQGDGRATAAVVDRNLLRRALDLFERAGHRVTAATPQALALPHERGTWSVAAFGDAASIRWGPVHGAAVGLLPSPAAELTLLAKQAPKPEAVVVTGDVDEREWSERLGVPVRRAPGPSVAPPVVLDLLQYEFAPRLAVGKSWRATIALAGLLAVVAIAGLNLHAATLRSEESALREAMARRVRESFPDVPVVLDPVMQMRRLVADLQPGVDPAGFIPLAAGLARLIPPDAVQRLEYQDGVLTATLRAEAEMAEGQRSALAGKASEQGFVLAVSGTAVRLSRKEAP